MYNIYLEISINLLIRQLVGKEEEGFETYSFLKTHCSFFKKQVLKLVTRTQLTLIFEMISKSNVSASAVYNFNHRWNVIHCDFFSCVNSFCLFILVLAASTSGTQWRKSWFSWKSVVQNLYCIICREIVHILPYTT